MQETTVARKTVRKDFIWAFLVIVGCLFLKDVIPGEEVDLFAKIVAITIIFYFCIKRVCNSASNEKAFNLSETLIKISKDDLVKCILGTLFCLILSDYIYAANIVGIGILMYYSLKIILKPQKSATKNL